MECKKRPYSVADHWGTGTGADDNPEVNCESELLLDRDSGPEIWKKKLRLTQKMDNFRFFTQAKESYLIGVKIID